MSGRMDFPQVPKVLEIYGVIHPCSSSSRLIAKAPACQGTLGIHPWAPKRSKGQLFGAAGNGSPILKRHRGSREVRVNHPGDGWRDKTEYW